MIIHHRIPISLLEFLRIGKFNHVKTGRSRDHVLQVFPAPEDWGPEKDQYRASVWRYGNFEFHFQDEKLIRIFNDYFPEINGGKHLEIDAWILNKKLSMLILQATLNQLKLAYQTSPGQFDQITVKILASNVELFFCPENRSSAVATDPNEYILVALSKNQ